MIGRIVALPLRVAALLAQSMLLALSQIWANKARSVLTMLGIIIGVASVTGVIAAMTGLRKKVLQDFESFGTNKIFISPDRPVTGPGRNISWSQLRFRPDDFDGLLDHCPSVRHLTRQMTQNVRVRHADRVEENVRVTGIDPDWHQIENRSVILGRPFSLIDSQQGRPVCLVNQVARDKLRLPRDPTGTAIIVGDRRFIIIGVVEPRAGGGMFGSDEQGLEVIIPFSTAWKMRQGYISVTATARSPEVSEDARAEIAFYLRARRHIRPGELDNFRMDVVQQFIDKFQAVALTITLVATGIVGISLIVGGVGIMNIMLVSVSERTREIGLRKAVGARPSAILLQFLVEAVTLCFVGGLIGVALGEGVARLMTSIPGARLEKAEIPMWAIGVSFGFAAVVGLVFGMFPAIKASRLDPIDALRHE